MGFAVEEAEMLRRVSFEQSLFNFADDFAFDSVPRVHVDNLSFADFFRNFATLKRPVVIEGMEMGIEIDNAWDEIRRMCYSMQLNKVSRRDNTSMSWAKLETIRVNTSLAEFMDEM